MTTLSANTYGSTARHHSRARAAHAKTGIAAADFSRIRNADLSRFTVDRLMAVINLLGARVDVAVKVRVPRAA